MYPQRNVTSIGARRERGEIYVAPGATSHERQNEHAVQNRLIAEGISITVTMKSDGRAIAGVITWADMNNVGLIVQHSGKDWVRVIPKDSIELWDYPV